MNFLKRALLRGIAIGPIASISAAFKTQAVELPSFSAHKNNQIFLNAPSGETWKQALLRLESMCRQDPNQYKTKREKAIVDYLRRDMDSGELFQLKEKESIERIKSYEKQYAVAVPKALVTLMCDYGLFQINMTGRFGGGRVFLKIYNSKYPTIPNIMPYTKGVANNFSSNALAIADLTTTQKQFMDQNYFFFGHLCEDDQEYVYLYFDRQGNFGEMYFWDEDIAKTMKKSLRPMLESSAEKFTLDALLSAKINRVAKLILNRADEYVN